MQRSELAKGARRDAFGSRHDAPEIEFSSSAMLRAPRSLGSVPSSRTLSTPSSVRGNVSSYSNSRALGYRSMFGRERSHYGHKNYSSSAMRDVCDIRASEEAPSSSLSSWGISMATLLALGLWATAVNADEEVKSTPEGEQAAGEETGTAEQPETPRSRKSRRKARSANSGDDDVAPAIVAKYLIIGAGTTAHAAIRAIRENDPDAQILVVTEETFVPYMRPPLSKDLWKSDDPNVAQTLQFKDWSGKESSVFFEPEEAYVGGNVTILRGTGVALLNVEDHEAHTKGGQVIKYEKCLIATGGTPFNKFPGDFEFGKDVTTFRDINDFRALDALTRDGEKSIVIAGGGFLGSELAWALSGRRNVKITQVIPESGSMANIFPGYLSDFVTDKLRNEGVDIKTGRLVSNITSLENNKVSVTLDNQETIVADHVVVAAGIVPNTEMAELAGLEIDARNKGVVVNAELQARSDVYAAGDVASYFDLFLGRRRVEHHDHASTSGFLAGENMTGKKKPYTHLPMFWGDLGPMGYEAVGDTSSKHNTVGVWLKPDGTPEESPKDFKRGIVYYLSPEQRVVGVLLWGLYGKTEEARRAIRRCKSFTDLSQLQTEISLEEAHH